MVHQQQALTEAEYEEFERLFVRPPPPAFKAYYMRANGGYVSEEDAEADKFGLPVSGFDPIKYGKSPIEEGIESLADIEPNEFGAWQKYEFIPFAYDSGDNIVFLSLREQDYESVYIFDMNVGTIAMVAPSFETFLSKLFKDDFS